MSELYKSLTDFLPMLENDKIGGWVINRVNDGTSEHTVQMPFLNYMRIVWEIDADGRYVV